MNKYRLIFVLILLLNCSCGSTLPVYQPLQERLLKVVDIYPTTGGWIDPNAKVKIRFSSSVDESSVNNESFFIVKSDQLPDDLSDIKDVDLAPLKIVYLFSEDDQVVEICPEESFVGNDDFSVVITSKLRSVNGLPFDSGEMNRPFVSNFVVDGAAGVETDSGLSTDGGGGPLEDEGQSVPRPAYLLINEFMYDAAGTDTNGDVFIELIGEPGGSLSGYYINFVNGDDGKTYKTISIPAGYSVPDDGLFVIADTDSSGKTNVAGADLLISFDPQNGPDAIQLIGPDNNLLDAVSYGSVTLAKGQNGLALFETAPAEDVSEGKSLTRVAGADDSNNNSVDFISCDIPTPGEVYEISAE